MLGNFTYCNPTKLYFGEQSLEGLHKELPKYGDRVVLKRAQYFITCSGRMLEGLRVREEGILSHLAALDRPALAQVQPEQLSLFGEEGAS